MITINKQVLETIAREQGFIRDNIEKVLRLVSILDYINHHELLQQSLALKGGTAINLAIFKMPRLSVDIDLDFAIPCDREDMLEYRNQINDVLLRYMEQEGYLLLPATKNPHTLDSWVFSYINAGGNKDVIKVEINYSDRCHILPIVQHNVSIDFLQSFSVSTLATIELLASKLNALVNRGAMRDMYDIWNMIRFELFVTDEERDLFRKSFVFYLTVGSSIPIGKIPTSFVSFPIIENANFSKIRAQLLPMLRKTEKFDFVEAKECVLKWLHEFLQFTQQEKEYINRFNKQSYCPELLFDDKDILSRIQQHPMALWRIR